MEGKDFCKENIGKEYLREGERVKLVGWNEKNCGVIITYKNGWSRGNIGIYDHIDNSILKQSDLLYYVCPEDLKEITEQNKTIVMEEKDDLKIASVCCEGKIVEVPKKGYLYIDLEKAKEYYLKGGVHREIALNAGYEESELNPVRNEWESKVIDHGTKCVSGWYLGGNSVYKETNEENTDKSTFKTEKQAKSALAYAQLTQLMALPEYNGDWVPDWSNSTQLKHCIEMDSMNIVSATFSTAYSKLSFKTAEIRNRFMENNYDLLKEYFELD